MKADIKILIKNQKNLLDPLWKFMNLFLVKSTLCRDERKFCCDENSKQQYPSNPNSYLRINYFQTSKFKFSVNLSTVNTLNSTSKDGVLIKISKCTRFSITQKYDIKHQVSLIMSQELKLYRILFLENYFQQNSSHLNPQATKFFLVSFLRYEQRSSKESSTS